MQTITYNEIINLEENIKELLVINIDDKLNQTKIDDCIKLCGEIKISGEVKTESGSKSFNHPINVELLVSNDQLITNEISVSIDDFIYKIENNKIIIDLIMKIEGLKEIEPYFPSTEDQKILQVEERQEISDIEANIEEEISVCEEEKENNIDSVLEDTAIIETNDKNENTSLLSQIFKSERIKKEASFLYHVVKKETSYEEIANLYNIDAEQLKLMNNNEEIYKDKLILIPKLK